MNASSVAPIETTDCAKPFANAVPTKLASLPNPRGALFESATSIVEITLGRDGSVIEASMVRSSGNVVADNVAVRTARASTYSPASLSASPFSADSCFARTFRIIVSR